MSPCVGVSSASSRRMNVDLPEPDGPMRKTNSPLSILRLTLSSAGRADCLYCLVTLSRLIITARQCSGGAQRLSDATGTGVTVWSSEPALANPEEPVSGSGC